ncbi:aspartate carbamoyltransferase catalytic subunit [Candidatus Calescamantes bacterium]|nr:aspartate carbamoyltransferase catalytic subunit [Candidatus Calescamantes bacterium]
MKWTKRHIISLRELDSEEIEFILDTTNTFLEILRRPIRKVPTLRGKTVANLFFEPSTRTRISFELAEKRLSADIINFTPGSSSVLKGETLLDTVRNIEAMKIDAVVVRHSSPGIPYFLKSRLNVSIINAGDGAHEHPTQGLLDLFTILRKKKRISGLKVAIVGDIRFSRVARSNIWGLTKLGAEVRLVSPPTLLPPFIEKLNVKVFYQLEEGIKDVDVIMVLRLQRERQKESFIPSIREYREFYGVTLSKLKPAKEDVLIMHPGPINRGVELDPEVADSSYSVILDQVTNGVAVRMAILYLLLGGEG